MTVGDQTGILDVGDEAFITNRVVRLVKNIRTGTTRYVLRRRLMIDADDGVAPRVLPGAVQWRRRSCHTAANSGR